MSHSPNRRELLRWSATLGVGLSLTNAGCTNDAAGPPATDEAQAKGPSDLESPLQLFRISLAQWSFHRSIFGEQPRDWQAFGEALASAPDTVLRGELDPLDFPATARSLDIDGVEYVNTFFYGHARDRDYLTELDSRCDGEGVESLLIMVDAEGSIGHPDEEQRNAVVDRHERWLEAAALLGCHSIRVNAHSEGTFEEQQKLAADGLRRLCERAEQFSLNVLVENHGGLSSNGTWLAGVMERVDHPLVGTLPDFGNFRLEGDEWYDRYQGVTELMAHAQAVSAKSHEFGADGDEINTDFRRMMKIVLDAGYRGWVGIEYEGSELPERDGVVATRDLLLKVREELAPQYA